MNRRYLEKVYSKLDFRKDYVLRVSDPVGVEKILREIGRDNNTDLRMTIFGGEYISIRKIKYRNQEMEDLVVVKVRPLQPKISDIGKRVKNKKRIK